jgi:perosamine synthetase
VSPWTMCASATAILHWNAIPVFADIEINTFCLDPKSIEDNITPYTKAIMAVDIFGHSANMIAIMNIAKKYNLKVISDCAQSIGAKYHGKYAGTLADIGGFSLNYHKHIHTGEGGILVTNDDHYADRLRLIRNHAEAVVGPKEENNLVNMVGYNFRLGEIECAIGLEQLKKLPKLIKSRQIAANRLNIGLKGLLGLTLPIVENDCSHVYYSYPMILNPKSIGVKKQIIAEALRAEGVPVSIIYPNVHLLPMFQKKIAFGSKGFPWSAEFCQRNVDYSKGICPNAENLLDETYLGIGLCNYEFNKDELKLIIDSFHKVWKNLVTLK